MLPMTLPMIARPMPSMKIANARVHQPAFSVVVAMGMVVVVMVFSNPLPGAELYGNGESPRTFVSLLAVRVSRHAHVPSRLRESIREWNAGMVFLI